LAARLLPARSTPFPRSAGTRCDIPDDAEGASGDLYLAVCVYSQNDTLPIVNASDIDKAVSEVGRFIKLALLNKSLEFQQKLNETIVLQEEEKIRDQVSKTIALHIEKFEYIDTHNKQEIENLRRQLLEKEMEFIDISKNYEENVEDMYVNPDEEDTTELGEVPQKPRKGHVNIYQTAYGILYRV
jgi:hypothetical protein